MSGFRSIAEYKQDRSRLGRPKFLSTYPFPVLLTPNRHQDFGSGYFTRPKTGTISAAGSYAAKLGFVVDESYLVIPIVKVEGRPFPERIGVGRTRGTDISLSENDVSKYHAYFSLDGDRWCITDANSSNGTFVNGMRLTAMTSVRLDDGALVAFGAQIYMFRVPTGFCDAVESS